MAKLHKKKNGAQFKKFIALKAISYIFINFQSYIKKQFSGIAAIDRGLCDNTMQLKESVCFSILGFLAFDYHKENSFNLRIIQSAGILQYPQTFKGKMFNAVYSTTLDILQTCKMRLSFMCQS